MRARVSAARALQRARYQKAGAKHVLINAHISGHLLEEIAMPTGEGLALLKHAADALQLSARGFHRTLRVARTLADLEGEERVERPHIAEALSYRGVKR